MIVPNIDAKSHEKKIASFFYIFNNSICYFHIYNSTETDYKKLHSFSTHFLTWKRYNIFLFVVPSGQYNVLNT